MTWVQSLHWQIQTMLANQFHTRSSVHTTCLNRFFVCMPSSPEHPWTASLSHSASTFRASTQDCRWRRLETRAWKEGASGHCVSGEGRRREGTSSICVYFFDARPIEREPWIEACAVGLGPSGASPGMSCPPPWCWRRPGDCTLPSERTTSNGQNCPEPHAQDSPAAPPVDTLFPVKML